MLTHGGLPRRSGRSTAGAVDSSTDADRRPAAIRTDIQALRALAVTLVVVYHVTSTGLPGGYVGVDVFLVISGFLITSHIVQGLTEDRFSIVDFYVRRARRLLPASLVTLSVVGAVTTVFLPTTFWNEVGRQVIASTLYIQNWVLAAGSVDYLQAGTESSPLQHFWSLSVEEQFYLVWPALLVLSGTVMAGRTRRIAALRNTIALALLVSLACSVLWTAAAPPIAYFATPTRVWELAAGGLLAVTTPALRGSPAARAALACGGLLAVLAAALLFDDRTPFPGVAALLPVLGTVAVIAAGDPQHPFAPRRVMSLRPVQFVGDHSYSIYLWHWPLLVIVPFFVAGPGREMSVVGQACVAAASIPVAYLSKRFVEDRFRAGGTGRRPSRMSTRRRGLITAIGSMAVVVALGLVPFGLSKAESARASTELQRFQALDQTCVGAAAFDSGCTSHTFGEAQPAPIIAGVNARGQSCQQGEQDVGPMRCDYGSDLPGAFRVALVGDSHAGQWLSAILPIAERQGWHVTTWTKSGCPYTSDSRRATCRDWNNAVADELRRGGFDLVVTSARSGIGYAGRASVDSAADGFAAAWRTLTASGISVVAIADVPQTGMAGLIDPASCVAAGGRCEVRESDALREDPLPTAAQRSGAGFVDLRDRFCRDGLCPAVIGGVVVYRDNDHMTSVYARSLSPYLGAALAAPRTG